MILVKEFTVGMSLVDYIPVVCFIIAATLLMRDLYNKMSKGAFALFAAGVIDIGCAGILKATYKLLYACNICDFEPLNNMFFPVQSIGFLLAGIGLLAMLLHRQTKKITTMSVAPVAPVVFTGTPIFVTFMVLGIGVISTTLSILSVKLKNKWLIVLFVITFVACMSMGYLSTKDFTDDAMNWLVEGINVVGQGSLLAGTIILHKAGLADLRLRGEIVE